MKDYRRTLKNMRISGMMREEVFFFFLELKKNFFLHYFIGFLKKEKQEAEVSRTELPKICSIIQYWRRQWHPTPVLLPGRSHGRRSLEGCSP